MGILVVVPASLAQRVSSPFLANRACFSQSSLPFTKADSEVLCVAWISLGCPGSEPQNPKTEMSVWRVLQALQSSTFVEEKLRPREGVGSAPGQLE